MVISFSLCDRNRRCFALLTLREDFFRAQLLKTLVQSSPQKKKKSPNLIPLIEHLAPFSTTKQQRTLGR